MKLDCVLTACNDNPVYIDFITVFVNTWYKLYPTVIVKIILISENIPTNLDKYTDNIILFKPIENISTAFISQYIRLLYPAILDYSGGIMITDIDILPMNSYYYTKNIANFNNDKFVYLRNVCMDGKQLAMCYNVATNVIWKEIFNIHSINDISDRLISVYNTINYQGVGLDGWSTDQLDLYKHVMSWNDKTNNFVYLNDAETGFNRLDRTRFVLSDRLLESINNGVYSDYHCDRPYLQYKHIVDSIVNSL